jgi:hypothetical protein
MDIKSWTRMDNDLRPHSDQVHVIWISTISSPVRLGLTELSHMVCSCDQRKKSSEKEDGAEYQHLMHALSFFIMICHL